MAFADGITFESKFPPAANSPSWIVQMFTLKLMTPEFAFDLGAPGGPLMYFGTSITLSLVKPYEFKILALNPTSAGYQHDSLAFTVTLATGTRIHTATVIGKFDNGCTMLFLPSSTFHKVIQLLRAAGVSSAVGVFRPKLKGQSMYIGYDCTQTLPPIGLTFVVGKTAYTFPFSASSLDYSAVTRRTPKGALQQCILPIELSDDTFAVIGMPLFLSQFVGFNLAPPTRRIIVGTRASG